MMGMNEVIMRNKRTRLRGIMKLILHEEVLISVRWFVDVYRYSNIKLGVSA